jgi:cytochrome c-type biogenesis protein CcmH
MHALAITLLLGAFAPQQAGSAPLADQALEARVQHLGKQLRCTVCQGMSIADSPNQQARALLDKVREMVAAGKSDQEILDYFVARYDEWILLEPRKSGFALVVWLGPALAIIAGFLFIIWFVLSRNAANRPAVPATSAAPALPEAAGAAGSPEDKYLNVVRAELER